MIKIQTIVSTSLIASAVVTAMLIAQPVQASSLTISYVRVTESNYGAAGESSSVNIILNGGSPASDVTINFTNNGQCTLNNDATGALVINAPDSAISATIKAINDENIEGRHTCDFSFITSSADPAFNGINQNYSATIDDNDGLPTLSIVVTQDSHIREGNLSFKNVYSIIRGDEEPTAPINLTVWTDQQCALKKTSGSGYTSQITQEVFDYAVPITVVANDDETPEGDHICHVQHRISTNDKSYQGNLVNSRYVTVEDNDGEPPADPEEANEEHGDELVPATTVAAGPTNTGFVGQVQNQPIRLADPDAANNTFIIVTTSAVILGAILGWWRWGRIGGWKTTVDKG